MPRVVTAAAGLLVLATLTRNAISEAPLQPEAPSQPGAPLRAQRLPPVGEGPSLPTPVSSAANGAINGARSVETLADAWAIALAVDRQLDAKRWNASSAEQTLALAHAERWPTLSVEGSYTVRDHESAFRVTSPPFPTTALPYRQANNVAVRSTLDVPLYTSGRIGHGIAAAAAETDMRDAEVRRWEMDLKMRVAEQYVSVLRAQRDIEVAQASVKSLEAHQRDVQIHFDHDRVPKNDLLAAQVALSDAQQLAIQVANRLDSSKAALNRSLGRPLITEVHLVEPSLSSVNVGDVEDLTALALVRRPERARLTAEAETLRQRADSVRASGRPQVGLMGDYSVAEDRFQVHEGIASIGVNASWNVFDAGRSQFKANAMRHQAEATMRLAEDLESQIGLEVRRAWLDVHETRRRLEVTHDALDRGEENLRVARKRYAAGVGVGTEVLDAQTLRAQTYRNHVSARYDAVLAHLRLRRATGNL